MDFSGVVFAWRKAGIISHFSRDIARKSTSSIESLISQYLKEDIEIGVDGVLLGDAPADAIQPQGLLNGVTPLTPSSATGTEAMVNDLRALAASIDPAATDLVYIMNSVQQAALVQLPNAAGVVFIPSAIVPNGTIVAIDASDFVSAADYSPVIDTVDDATVVTADPAAPITYATGAQRVPTSSFWQIDLLGCRVLQELALDHAPKRQDQLCRRRGVVTAMVKKQNGETQSPTPTVRLAMRDGQIDADEMAAAFGECLELLRASLQKKLDRLERRDVDLVGDVAALRLEVNGMVSGADTASRAANSEAKTLRRELESLRIEIDQIRRGMYRNEGRSRSGIETEAGPLVTDIVVRSWRHTLGRAPLLQFFGLSLHLCRNFVRNLFRFSINKGARDISGC